MNKKKSLRKALSAEYLVSIHEVAYHYPGAVFKEGQLYDSSPRRKRKRKQYKVRMRNMCIKLVVAGTYITETGCTLRWTIL